MQNENYEWDVAFSLLEEDRSIAKGIIDCLKKGIKYFIYYENQQMLNGQNAVTTFKDIFKNKARIVVILYRDKWGKTDYTSLEEEAIIDRYKKQRNFLVIVSLEKPRKAPAFYPETNLIESIHESEQEKIAGIIEFKLKEEGVIFREESIDTITERMQKKIKDRQEEIMFINSPESIESVIKEVQKMMNRIEAFHIDFNKNGLGIGIESNKNQYQNNYFLRCLINNYCFDFRFQQAFNNTSRDSILTIKIFKVISNNLKDKEEAKQYEFAYNKGLVGWSEVKKEGDFTTSETLIENWLRNYVLEIENHLPI